MRTVKSANRAARTSLIRAVRLDDGDAPPVLVAAHGPLDCHGHGRALAARVGCAALNRTEARRRTARPWARPHGAVPH
eukprot:3656478-Prymnesium_polylepis.1